jgi:hypothetical protein
MLCRGKELMLRPPTMASYSKKGGRTRLLGKSGIAAKPWHSPCSVLGQNRRDTNVVSRLKLSWAEEATVVSQR